MNYSVQVAIPAGYSTSQYTSVWPATRQPSYYQDFNGQTAAIVQQPMGTSRSALWHQPNQSIFPTAQYTTTPQTPQPELRLIIIRHGERVDAAFGQTSLANGMDMMNEEILPEWILNSFSMTNSGIFQPRIKYTPFHSNMPPSLPKRRNMYEYSYDTPLTRTGLEGAVKVGQILKMNNINIDVCFCSPSTRTVQTARGVLEGNGFPDLQINIDLDLFECFGWNPFLQRLSEFPFLTVSEWHSNGLRNCYGPSSRVSTSSVNCMESEMEYYARSARVISNILQHAEQFRLASSSGGCVNVLIAGHAPTAEAITAYLMNRMPNVEAVRQMALQVRYLCMVMPERLNGIWTMRSNALMGTTLSRG